MNFIAAVLLLLLPQPGIAHIGDRVFSIPYLSAYDLATIELDGYVEDWKELLGEPTLTPFDFNPFYHAALTSYAGYDPSSLDFQAWVAWTDGGKLYVALEAADNLYRDYDDPTDHYFSDHIVLEIDGDHSGGEYVFLRSSGFNPRNVAQAQYYEVKAYSEQQHQLIAIPFGGRPREWMARPPYAAASGTVLGERPTYWIVEFYVTAFDDVLTRGPEESVISTFQPGQIIGLDVGVFDWDDSDTRMAQFYLHDPEDEMALQGADSFVDAILLGPDRTAVENDTWARIKAAVRPE